MKCATKATSITVVVRDIIEGGGKCSRFAVDKLIEIARTNPAIHNTLIKYGAEQAVRDYYHSQRRIFNRLAPAKESRNPVADAERTEQKRKRRMFWDRYALFGHMQLKTATRPHLSSSIQNRKIQAEGNLRCAGFEQDIMDRMKDDKITVGKQFKASEIVEIAEKHNVI